MSTSVPLTRGAPSLRRVARTWCLVASNLARTAAARSGASLSNCFHVAMPGSLAAGSDRTRVRSFPATRKVPLWSRPDPGRCPAESPRHQRGTFLNKKGAFPHSAESTEVSPAHSKGVPFWSMAQPTHDLPYQQYCDNLGAELWTLAATVDEADPDIPVRTCGAWTLRMLVEHTGHVHRWAAAIVGKLSPRRLYRKAADWPLPADPADWATWLTAGGRELMEVLHDAEPAAPV